MWSMRRMEIHRYVFQQSYRSRWEAKRMRGKRGWLDWRREEGREIERERGCGEGARGKRTKREKEGEREGGKATQHSAVATTTMTTARLNANSFIDWNSKSSSFDSCTTFSLHSLPPPPPPFAASVVEPRAIRIPVRTFAFLHLLSSPTTISRFPPPLFSPSFY